jgi:hypothetical protein
MQDCNTHGHSPAPWQVNALGAVRGANGYLLAEVLHAGSEVEGRANQALIGAAPDLLKALERLSFAAMCRDNVMGDPCRLLDAKAELAAANQQACAAVAKARGA